MIQIEAGRCVLCIGVPEVTEKLLPQSRQANWPGRALSLEAWPITPQCGQVGPAGQRARSSNARHFSSSQKRACKATRLSGTRPGLTITTYRNSGLKAIVPMRDMRAAISDHGYGFIQEKYRR